MRIYLVMGFIGLLSPKALAQNTVEKPEGKRPLFLGLNPSVTVEKSYTKGAFDLGVFPLVAQRSLTGKLDLRVSTILNLRLRDTVTALSHVGLEFAFPFFPGKEREIVDRSTGFYVAPAIGFGRNFTWKHTNLTVAVEPGYFLPVGRRFSMCFAFQFGATYISHDVGYGEWGAHWGGKFILGWWFEPGKRGEWMY